MKTESLEKETAKPNGKINGTGGLDDIFDAHIAREFADRDVDATMETMVPEPYVHCVPIMTGGAGGQGVRRFYSEHSSIRFPKMPR
jgi:carboxymethylenebutenolidase